MQTALITGTSRGLGLSLVKEGLARGQKIIATFRHVNEALEQLKKEYPETLLLVAMDVMNSNSVTRAYEEITRQVSSIDIIINNAAVLNETRTFTGDPVLEMDLDMLEETLLTNVVGPAKVLKYFAPLLYKGNGKCIIQVTSEGAVLKDSGHHYIAYATSKAALNMYSQRIRNYYAQSETHKDIRLYMVHPGRMFTDMGIENAQIQPSEPATGIWDIVQGKIKNNLSIPFIDYKGNSMLFS